MSLSLASEVWRSVEHVDAQLRQVVEVIGAHRAVGLAGSAELDDGAVPLGPGVAGRCDLGAGDVSTSPPIATS